MYGGVSVLVDKSANCPVADTISTFGFDACDYISTDDDLCFHELMPVNACESRIFAAPFQLLHPRKISSQEPDRPVIILKFPMS